MTDFLINLWLQSVSDSILRSERPLSKAMIYRVPGGGGTAPAHEGTISNSLTRTSSI